MPYNKPYFDSFNPYFTGYFNYFFRYTTPPLKNEESFEEVALKLLQSGKEDELKEFIVNKLDTLGPSDKAQITMLLLWVIEILLNQMGALKNEDKNGPEHEMLQLDFQAVLSQKKFLVSVNK